MIPILKLFFAAPDEWFDEKDSRFNKLIEDIDKKILRLKKKQKITGESMVKIESEVPMDNDKFQEQLKIAKGQIQFDYALKMSEMMFHENAKTEALLVESLEQLKKLFMCSYTSFRNTDTEKIFKDFLGKISCVQIQFRENKLCDNNEEDGFDQLGEFYGNLVNLNKPLQDANPTPNAAVGLNETVVLDSTSRANETIVEKDDLILTIEQNPDDNAEDEDEEEDQGPSPARWRPPTPPKASPKIPESDGQAELKVAKFDINKLTPSPKKEVGISTGM